MRNAAVILLTTILAACGAPKEGEFIPAYADAWCSYVMECSDPAQLTFDGVLEHEDCLALYGEDVAARGSGCKYKKRKAQECLDAMSFTTCPAEGAPLEKGLPPICEEVYVKCSGSASSDADLDEEDTAR